MRSFKKDKNLIGVCGLYCGGCDNYLAFTKEGYHLLNSKKYLGQNLSKLECEGCNSNKQSDHCSKCEMRLCAKDKGILHCGKCNEYPCEKLKQFKEEAKDWPGAVHRKFIFSNLKEISKTGEVNWLNKSENYWKCGCGQRFSYYESTCFKCGKALHSYSK